MEVENQLKEVSFGGIDSSHPHDCWRKGRRPKWDGLFTTIISPIPDKISCIFFSNFRRWTSNPGALGKFMIKSFTHPNLWHGPRILTCAKNIKKTLSWECSFAPTKTIPNQLQQSIHHPPTSSPNPWPGFLCEAVVTNFPSQLVDLTTCTSPSAWKRRRYRLQRHLTMGDCQGLGVGGVKFGG